MNKRVRVFLFGLAALDRFRLTPGVTSGGATARRTMVRSILMEVALVAAIPGANGTTRVVPKGLHGHDRRER